MTRVVWVAIVVVACGHPATPPAVDPHPQPPVAHADAATDAPLDHDLPRLALRATKLYQDIVQVLAAAAEDCAAATTKLAGLQTAYADVVAANAKVLHDGRARELRAALESHAAELDAAAKSIVEAKTMKACSADHAFTDTFDTLVGAPP